MSRRTKSIWFVGTGLEGKMMRKRDTKGRIRRGDGDLFRKRGIKREETEDLTGKWGMEDQGQKVKLIGGNGA